MTIPVPVFGVAFVAVVGIAAVAVLLAILMVLLGRRNADGLTQLEIKFVPLPVVKFSMRPAPRARTSNAGSQSNDVTNRPDSDVTHLRRSA